MVLSRNHFLQKHLALYVLVRGCLDPVGTNRRINQSTKCVTGIGNWKSMSLDSSFVKGESWGSRINTSPPVKVQLQP